MNTLRIMTYHVQGCRGGDGRVDPQRVLQVIADGAPDIVALQGLDTSPGQDQLQILSERLGMRAYGTGRNGANAFLSYYPLHGLQDFDLGEGGRCSRADVDVGGKRLHLLNLRMEPPPRCRRGQIASLLGPELLGNPSMACPALVLGDFADTFWGAGNFDLALALRKARRPLWPATFPARFPLVGRDRAYLCGDIRIVDAHIQRTRVARMASSHLPLILTVQVTDPRTYLKLKKIHRNRMEIAPG
ncbi:endonuclease/exonuclease/phosphatase family protein [uncultured Desulfuromonas sp.]|uniref:endonuclease/exonuclease/phosphatase family protein n=1 Tax=uncultured Desulfuromonas sp. TaxID=181013 RepID=UPI00262FD262|nr:endonuclease/exonuclease/phosphatase family protein [uncultured Desulfuromonas sp.]